MKITVIARIQKVPHKETCFRQIKQLFTGAALETA